MQTLNQDLKDGRFRPVYLLYGEEAFLKNSYKNRLKEAVAGGDGMNLTTFGGKETDVDELIRLADTMPFFAEKRLIVVENSGFFKSSGEALVKYLPQMPETTCLLFVEDEVDKRSRLFKKVKELGLTVELARQDSGQLARWAAGILSREGKKITSKTMEYFLETTGDDMENIHTELEKLISYVGERSVITDQDVQDICSEHVTGKIFEMTAAIANRQTRRTMELYEDLLTLKEPPLRILFLIARQFNQLLQVKELAAKGMDQGSIASRLKLKPFAVGKILQQARQFSGEQLLSYVGMCVDAEEAVKNGRLQERLAVELLITYHYGAKPAGTGKEKAGGENHELQKKQTGGKK